MEHGLLGSEPVVDRSRGAEAIWDWRGSKAVAAAAERRRQVRRQGTLQAIVAAVVAACVYLVWSPWVAAAVGAVAVLTAALAWLAPDRLYPRLRRGLAAFGRAVGTLVTWLLLAPFFYLVVTPLGLFLRRGRRDPMRRAIDRHAGSYWQTRAGEPSPPASYERQF